MGPAIDASPSMLPHNARVCVDKEAPSTPTLAPIVYLPAPPLATIINLFFGITVGPAIGTSPSMPPCNARVSIDKEEPSTPTLAPFVKLFI